MARIGVAGGLGGMGVTIIEQLLLAKKHEILVLTRSEPKPSQELSGVKYLVVRYGDEHIDELATTLEKNQISTIISAIGVFDQPTSDAQLNLIHAAVKSSATTRFIPSEFYYLYKPEHVEIDPTVQYYLDAAALLKSSNLQYTRVINGLFMDYWGMPHARSHLRPYSWGMHVLLRRAVFPGNGEQALSLTRSVDVARLVVNLVDLQTWNEFSALVGTDTNLNKALKLAEKARGGKPFDTVYQSAQQLENGQATVLPMAGKKELEGEDVEMLKDIFTTVGQLYLYGVYDVPHEYRLDKDSVGFEPMRLEEFLQEAWKDVPVE